MHACKALARGDKNPTIEHRFNSAPFSMKKFKTKSIKSIAMATGVARYPPKSTQP